MMMAEPGLFDNSGIIYLSKVFETTMTSLLTSGESIPQGEFAATLQLARDFELHHRDISNPLLTVTNDVAQTENVRVPYSIHSVVPIGAAAVKVLVPGLGASQRFYHRLANELALRGATAITVRPARHQGVHSLDLENLLHPEALLPKEIEAVTKDAYNTYGLHVFEFDGHSWGGISAATAAKRQQMQRDRSNSGPVVTQVGLIESAGVTDHNLLTLGLHLPKVALESAVASVKYPKIVPETLKHFYANIARTGGEILKAANCRLSADELGTLAELGIRTVADFHEDDGFFPAAAAYQRIGGAVAVFNTGHDGGHLAPLTHAPQVARDMMQIDQAAFRPVA
jgi:hypothetical protein